MSVMSELDIDFWNEVTYRTRMRIAREHYAVKLARKDWHWRTRQVLGPRDAWRVAWRVARIMMPD